MGTNRFEFGPLDRLSRYLGLQYNAWGQSACAITYKVTNLICKLVLFSLSSKEGISKWFVLTKAVTARNSPCPAMLSMSVRFTDFSWMHSSHRGRARVQHCRLVAMGWGVGGHTCGSGAVCVWIVERRNKFLKITSSSEWINACISPSTKCRFNTSHTELQV